MPDTEDAKDLQMQLLRNNVLKHEKEYAKESIEVEFKAVGYLLTADGAGLAGSLALLKDYAATPQLKGIGFFIACFAFGFLAACIRLIRSKPPNSSRNVLATF